MIVKNQGSGVHVCQVPTCTAVINRRHLMCAMHWFDVPMEQRTEVTKTLGAWLAGETNATPYWIARLTAIVSAANLRRIDCPEEKAKLEKLLNAQPLADN